MLAVFDGSRPATDEENALIRRLADSKKTVVAVINKGDLPPCRDTVRMIKAHFDECVEMSARDGDAERLREIIERLFIDDKIRIGTDAVVANARQHASLLRAREHVSLALSALTDGFPCDVAASDVELAIGAIAELDGRLVSESVVSEIFSRFCVGK